MFSNKEVEKLKKELKTTNDKLKVATDELEKIKSEVFVYDYRRPYSEGRISISKKIDGDITSFYNDIIYKINNQQTDLMEENKKLHKKLEKLQAVVNEMVDDYYKNKDS